MRLIDADELVKDRVENDPVRISVMCTKTAYDVDKVVRQLEKEYINSINMLRQDIGTAFQFSSEVRRDCYKRAIEIVKAGSINDNSDRKSRTGIVLPKAEEENEDKE